MIFAVFDVQDTASRGKRVYNLQFYAFMVKIFNDLLEKVTWYSTLNLARHSPYFLESFSTAAWYCSATARNTSLRQPTPTVHSWQRSTKHWCRIETIHVAGPTSPDPPDLPRYRHYILNFSRVTPDVTEPTPTTNTSLLQLCHFSEWVSEWAVS